MIPLALAGIAAMLLDLGTASPATERNPIVIALGPDAPFVKLAVLAFAVVTAWLLRDSWGHVVLGVLVVVGCVGALSNAGAVG